VRRFTSKSLVCKHSFRESNGKCFDFANGEKFNTGTMPGSQTLLEPRVGFNLMLKVMRQLYFVEVVVYSQVEHQVFSCRMLLENVLTGFVDASGAALSSGGYGFTANPNDYFIPATPTLPSDF
jgi:hypothetical protein